ncbi:MAG: DUF3373 family protein [Chloroflexota bacterium]
MRGFLVILLSLSLLLPLPALAVDQADLMKKIDELSKELEKLKQQMQEVQKQEVQKEERITKAEAKADKAASMWPSWFELGGDYRFRFDSLNGKVHEYMQYNPLGPPFQPAPGFPFFLATGVSGYTAKNDTLLTNRFGLNMKVNATEDITVKARLLMYKVWGHETETPVQGNFFSDRAFGPFDGVITHVPSDNALRVDYAYATWSNIAGLPTWFSIGRRPSTGGIPGNLRLNTERIGTAGIPNMLVDYAFDGLSAGFAPDIEALPGAYMKVCYGRGFDSGFDTENLPQGNSLKDTDFLGVNIVPYDTDNLHIELQWQHGFDIFNSPSDGFDTQVDTGLLFGGPPSGQFITVHTPVKTNLGSIDWVGGVVTGKLDKLGPGNLNLFVSSAGSFTHPNSNTFQLPFFSLDGTTFQNAGFGLLYNDDPTTPGVDKKSHTGWGLYLGARYDLLSTGTKIGLEYNHGSRYWIGMIPAGDDMWTSKLGTRGDVYEAYVIQQLNKVPIAKRGNAFVRLGYQYYSFDYTGTNNWVGQPLKINNLSTTDPSGTQLLAPLKNAHDIYFTFDVVF